METVNIADGKRLGKVCDVAFTFPEGRVCGIIVPGGRGMRWGKPEMFIDLKDVVRIGVDVVLVDIRCAPPSEGKKRGRHEPTASLPEPPRQERSDRRDYGEYE